MPPIRIHQRVAAEFDEAYAWYAERSPVAAERFAQCFDMAIERLRQRPGTGALWRASYRRTRLNVFPYLLIFHLGHRQLSVLALVHSRRNADRVLSAVRVRLKKLS